MYGLAYCGHCHDFTGPQAGAARYVFRAANDIDSRASRTIYLAVCEIGRRSPDAALVLAVGALMLCFLVPFVLLIWLADITPEPYAPIPAVVAGVWLYGALKTVWRRRRELFR